MDTRPLSLTAYSLRRKPGAILAGSAAITIPTADGISAPRGLASTPPGVLTKLESIILKTGPMENQSSSQNVCISCSKQSVCLLCKKCTLEKLKFYSRRERLAAAEKEKSILVTTIEKIASKASEIQAEINSRQARIVLLKRNIEKKLDEIGLKDQQARSLESERSECARYSSQLTKMFSKHEEKKREAFIKEEEKRHKLDNMQLKNIEMRRKLAVCICCIFPIAEYFAEAVNVGEDDPCNTKWAVVSGNDPMAEGRIFMVGAASISESLLNRLSCELANSTLSLPSDLRSPFAAVGYTFQLIHLLAVLFDYRLPYNISYKDFALCDHWSKELFDTRWLKLSDGVFSFCLHLGIPPEKLHVHYPHSNILEIGSRMVQGSTVTMGHFNLVNSSHREELGDPVTNTAFEERDLKDWDICSDFDG